MIATYAAVLAVCGASLSLGQAAITLCGLRGWSWLSPAVGLALLCALCWGTVRLPGNGVISALAVVALSVAALLFLRRHTDGVGEGLKVGAPIALLALVAASLPFLVEDHFGILGTSFNPDMSQHLLATARLAHGQPSQLLRQGYPLGPHAIVVALNKGLGIGLVQGFTGLTVAVVILASLTALGAFATLPVIGRISGALLVGVPYLAASYFAQGDFKETMQALFVLAFALALRQISRFQGNPNWLGRPLRMVPLALIAAGSVYTYSFPGLTWLIGTAAVWAIAELVINRAGPGRDRSGSYPATKVRGSNDRSIRSFSRSPALLAVLVFIVLTAPEIGRMIDFRDFETFDPTGPGLGNLFGQISPFESLGIWPSGDFRLAPGNGLIPAGGYYVAIAFASILMGYGLFRCWRRRETAIISAMIAAALAYAAARVGGTPYTAAKAIEIAAPLAALTILSPLLDQEGVGFLTWLHRSPLRTFTAALFILAAGICSLLALANAPVGPSSYTPALAELRPLVAAGSTEVLAAHNLLADQHGLPYIAWELRGGRVCIESDSEAGPTSLPGVRFVITEGSRDSPPFHDLRLRRVDPPYELWERTASPKGHSPCPLIAVRQARQGPAR